MRTKQDVIQWIEEHRDRFIQIADDLWAHPEVAWQEFRSSKVQADYLETKGFRVTWGSGGIQTAFIAEWGSG